jgi:predicted DNA-binding transcriptional regulator YafY
LDRLERFYRIDQMLVARRIVPRQVFLDELEVSLATFKRDLEYMRDRFNAPVIWDAEARGYRYQETPSVGRKFELPGLWFDEREAYALLMMQSLLSSLDQGGLIGPHIEPLMARLNAILGSGQTAAGDLHKRFRILTLGTRKIALEHFSAVGAAVSRRERIAIEYYARGSNETTRREISPQRLIYYRENWYVDAWCHLRDGLRSFSIDGIRSVQSNGKKAREVSNKALEDYLASGYGIFGGEFVRWAKLRFSAERARWVSSENWHPEQRSTFDEAGRYLLEVPYSVDQELMMDILRHGAEVEVLEPADLRQKVGDEHQKAAARHGTAPQ